MTVGAEGSVPGKDIVSVEVSLAPTTSGGDDGGGGVMVPVSTGLDVMNIR